MLNVETSAPDFTLPDQNGSQQTLTSYLGQWVVLYFYPKDDTPGCTKEACAIAEVYDEFANLGVTVFGVSKDSTASHAKFAAKYQLPFLLLSDSSLSVIASYEALKEKTWLGKNVSSISRVTYLINPQGIIVKVYPKVDPSSHALQILSDLKALGLVHK